MKTSSDSILSPERDGGPVREHADPQPRNAICESLVSLCKRDGLYYARVNYSIMTEPIEIALHGINTEEQARAAATALITNAACATNDAE